MEKDEFKDLSNLSILLADDDQDDCLFFKEALKELSLSAKLITVHDDEQLIDWFTKLSTLTHGESSNLSHVLFLDLNMPRKFGSDCLMKIEQMERLKHIPIIIFSTSLDMTVVDLLYDSGANYYIRKSGNFSALKSIILEAINCISHNDLKKPERERFILQSQNK